MVGKIKSKNGLSRFFHPVPPLVLRSPRRGSTQKAFQSNCLPLRSSEIKWRPHRGSCRTVASCLFVNSTWLQGMFGCSTFCVIFPHAHLLGKFPCCWGHLGHLLWHWLLLTEHLLTATCLATIISYPHKSSVRPVLSPIILLIRSEAQEFNDCSSSPSSRTGI